MTFNNNLQQTEQNSSTFYNNDKLERFSYTSPYAPTTTTIRSASSKVLDKQNQSSTNDKSKCNKLLHDCCYSISNLALIIFPILAVIFCIKFLQDDPLYEYGEHLLSLRFYRQIIFIIIILPLVLLVPIFNALIGFFFNNDLRRQDSGNTLSNLKLMYMILVAIFAFIGLILVAPSIRSSSVAYQVDYELRNHMKKRFENEFSYVFLDKIQEQYECCDQLWYRANYFDKMPLSCFYASDPTYSLVYERTCDVVIGQMVGTRCIIIAFSLVIILISLALLISVDICELLRDSNQQYNIEERESKLMMNRLTNANGRRHDDEEDDDEDNCDEEEANNPLPPRASSFRIITNNNNKVRGKPSSESPSSMVSESDKLLSELDHGLRTNERMDETSPLAHQNHRNQDYINRPSSERTSPKSCVAPMSLHHSSQEPYTSDESEEDEEDQDDEERFHNDHKDDAAGARLTPILTRANYVPAFRSQSPIFPSSQPPSSSNDHLETYTTSPTHTYAPTSQSHTHGHSISPTDLSIGRSSIKPAMPSPPTKGVLKKTSSFQQIDADDYDDDDHNVGNELDRGQHWRGQDQRTPGQQQQHNNNNNNNTQLQRGDFQGRRSLMNVRFAE